VSLKEELRDPEAQYASCVRKFLKFLGDSECVREEGYSICEVGDHLKYK
jgi:hypothetical protein